MAIDYENNKKYFKPLNIKAPAIMIVIGVIMLTGGGAVTFIGLLLAAGGGGLFYLQLAGRPSDHDIDRALDEALGDLQRQAMSKLGIDEDDVKLIDPVIIGGPYFANISTPVQVKLGKDKKVRSSNTEGIAMYFSEHQLHAYKFQVSITEAGERRENTDEYFYRDVVSVSTQSETEQVYVNGSSETVNYEVFKLTTSGGTSITSAMRDTDSRASKAISGARQLVRDRKIQN